MTEDSFHLTPHDIRAQEFQRTLRGYDQAQVEEFKQRIAEEFDRLLREKSLIEERQKGMVEQLRAYRERERALNDALVTAQQLRAEAASQAEREADLLRAKAEQESLQLLAAAQGEADRIRGGLDALKRQHLVYLTTWRNHLERQLAELTALENQASKGELP